MSTFGDWERTVLEHTYDNVDLISCHAYYQESGDDLGSFLAYYQESGDDLGSFLASSLDREYFISTVVATADRATSASLAQLVHRS